jgi:hypothetical protein
LQLCARSLGSAVDVHSPRHGTVHSVFPAAINAVVDGALWSVIDVARPDIPFGIRVDGRRPGSWGRVASGHPVHVRAGQVSVGPIGIDCRMATRWEPVPWPEPAPGLGARLTIIETAASPRAWCGTAAMALAVTEALDESNDGRLAACVGKVVGRGAGLTPAGDDLLVGVFAALLSSAAGSAGQKRGARLSAAIRPLLTSTGDVSGHLLLQASRGLFGRSLHELGAALMEDDSADCLGPALASVLSTGATSGADACLGLVAAARLSFRVSKRNL